MQWGAFTLIRRVGSGGLANEALDWFLQKLLSCLGNAVLVFTEMVGRDI